MHTPNKFLLLLVIINLVCLRCFATVVSNLPTGGTGISADKSVGSPGAGYTALGTLTLTSAKVTDITALSGTVTLTAPSGWQFQANTGTVTGAGNLMIAFYSISSTSVTISYINTTGSLSNAITITGLLVQPTNGKANSSNIVATSSPAIAGLSNNNVAVLSEVAGAFTKLQVLVPGETTAPGTVSGKTGTPTAQTVGVKIAGTGIVINAVDAYWNRVTTVTDNVDLITNDAWYGPTFKIATLTLVSGTVTTKTVILRNVSSPTYLPTFTVNDATDGSKTSNTSSTFTVTVGSYSKLQILLPGQTAAPGTPTGVTGTAIAPVAGVPYAVTVNAVDAGFNLVTSVTNNVLPAINTIVDGYATLPSTITLASGTATFNITFIVAVTTEKIIVTDQVNSTIKTTLSSIVVGTAGFSKILLVMPGETIAPGSATGKSGTPSAATAGSNFIPKVYAVDNYFNTVTSINDALSVNISDANGTFNTNPGFVSGITPTSTTNSLSLKVIFKTATTPSSLASITVTDGSFTYTQSNIVVNAGALKKLLIVFAATETYAPGTTTGKTGSSPTSVTAGTPFTVNVYGVDAQFNTVSSTDAITIKANNDANAAFSGPTNLTAGTATFTATFRTAGASVNKTISVTDATTVGIAAYTTSAFSVAVGAYSQLQILLPGEISKPGTVSSSTPGKSGTANAVRSTNFITTVNAVDACYNIITSITSPRSVALALANGGAGSSMAASATFSSGVAATTSSTFITSTSSSPLPTITATDATSGFTATVPVPIPPSSTSSPTDYFTVAIDGDWSNSATWQSSATGAAGSWHAATLAPGTSASSTTIPSGNTVTISSGTISVGNGGKLTVDNGGTLTLTGGTLSVGTNGAIINGTVINAGTISGTGSVAVNGGTLTNSGTVSPAGGLSFDATAKYQHNFTGAGAIPTATWNNTSTCEIIGYTTFNSTMTGTNQTFGNFIYNCTNQSTGAATLNGAASVNNLTIISTGSSTGTFQLSTGAAGSVTVTVRGSYIQAGGTVNLSTSSTGIGNLNISGDFNISGGTIKTAGTSTIAFAGSGTIASPQNFIKSGGTISGAVNYAVNSGTAVDFGTNVLDGSTGTFTLNGGGTLITANDDGITSSGAVGSIQSSGTRTFSTTANYVYDGINAQSAGTGFPASFNNLTVNNSQGLTMPSGTGTGSYTIGSGGALTLTSGNLDMNNNALAFGGTVTVTGTGTIKTQNTSSTPLPSGITWAVGIEYSGTSDQTLVSGIYNNLSFSGLGTKKATSGTIDVKGNWSSADGKVDVLTSAPTVQFTGASQTLNDNNSDGGNGVVFGTVIFGGISTKTLNSGSFSVAPLGYLTMSGSATLAANAHLTILADGTGSGNVGALPAGTAITGNVNVQTFFNGKGDVSYRGYRLISSPVYDAASGGTAYNLSYLQGKGSYLTGAGGTASGFDASGNPTLYLYREDKIPSSSLTSGNYRGITAINGGYIVSTIDGSSNLGVGNGVVFFFRGNNTTVSTNAPNDITLSATGPLNQGQITVSPWFTGGSNLSYNSATVGDPRAGITGYNLVGNPYACSIDWNTAFSGTSTTGIYAPNTDKSIYIYNPQSKTYISYLTTGINSGICSVNTIIDGNIIPSGQGFFVRATAANPQLIFNESAKVNAHPSVLSLNAAAPTVVRQMNLQLSKDSISKDENAIVFNESAHNDYVVAEDVEYLQGSGVVSLSNLSADNQRLSINQLPLPKSTQVIRLNMAVSALGQYKFTITRLKNIPNIYSIWLVDNFMKDSLDMRINKDYAFMVSSDAASYSANRFKLIMKPNPALSVHLLNFAATKNASDVKINWIAENESDYTKYILQRSIDGGMTYKILDSLTSANLGTYNDLDPHPATGQNKYRLKQIDVLGNVSYSNVVTVMYSIPGNNSIVSSRISLYPNPTANTLNVAVKTANNTAATGSYKITVTSTSGVIVKSATSTQADWHSDVSSLTPGTYFIEVINLKDNSLTGRTSFIKF